MKKQILEKDKYKKMIEESEFISYTAKVVDGEILLSKVVETFKNPNMAFKINFIVENGKYKFDSFLSGFSIYMDLDFLNGYKIDEELKKQMEEEVLKEIGDPLELENEIAQLENVAFDKEKIKYEEKEENIFVISLEGQGMFVIEGDIEDEELEEASFGKKRNNSLVLYKIKEFKSDFWEEYCKFMKKEPKRRLKYITKGEI